MTSILAIALGAVIGVGGPVTGVSIHSAASHTEVVVAVNGDIDVRDFVMQGPDRLILDLVGARHELPGDQFVDVNRGGIQAIRTSQYSEDVVRLVFELDGPLEYSIQSSAGAVRVTLVSDSEPFASWNTDRAFDVAGSAGGSGGAPVIETPVVVAPTVQQAAVIPVPALAITQEVRRPITIAFTNTPIRDVLFTFAEFADRSIVPGSDVEGLVSADIRAQPWDLALHTLLGAYGLVARELDNGIIRVDNVQNLFDQEAILPMSTQPFRVNYAQATELEDGIRGLLTERGRVSVGEGTNTLVVTDIQRVLIAVGELITELDVETPQVNIAAKIIFVNRTDLDEFGVTYDLKDSQGNQLNKLAPGALDANGDGFISLPDEQVAQGVDVFSLGGNSLAALGNATNRVTSPTLQLLTSLVIGRSTLIGFIDALESVQLTDVVAQPSIQVLDNRTARIVVGEETPVRVIDAGSRGGGGGGGGGARQAPIATVNFKETGVILEVTPHVTAGDNILLQLYTERSSADIADSDVGLTFRKQTTESRVMVKDGETVVVSGLMVTEVTEVNSGIPLLMDLPVIGGLFRTHRQRSVQRDLMILVTPTIIRRDFP